MPIPIAAGLIASMVWTCQEYDLHGKGITIAAAIITVLAGISMVSSLRYYSFKDLEFKSSVPFIAIIAAMLVLGFVLLDPALVLFILASLYILSGLVITIVYKLRERKSIQTSGE